jgi:hypothetical protein
MRAHFILGRSTGFAGRGPQRSKIYMMPLRGGAAPHA